MEQDKRYQSAVATLDGRIRTALERLPNERQTWLSEIRMRVGRPLCVMEGARPNFIRQDGTAEPTPSAQSLVVERDELKNIFISLCGWAVHSHQKELCDGFIAVRGGHRAGIAATAVVQEGGVTAVRDILSINLRVAREIHGAANELMCRCFAGKTGGLLLAGMPASGKTTLLRDLARQLASAQGGFKKVCVVDESGELGGAFGGLQGCDLGVCSDLLTGYPKAKGLQIAVRCLSPQVIICDEIASIQEIQAVVQAANSGVAVVTSIHAGCLTELKRKRHFAPLMQTGAFAYVAVLAGIDRPCELAALERTDAL